MSIILLTRYKDSITGSINGEPFGVAYSDERFAQMQELEKRSQEAESLEDLHAIIEAFKALTNDDYSELIAHAGGGEYLFVNPATGQLYLRLGDTVSKEVLPQGLVNRVVESIEKGLDVLPLVKAWTRMLRNPHYSVEKGQRFVRYINTLYVNQELVQKLMEKGTPRPLAEERATTYQTPITREGIICTYKVSDEITTRFVKDSEAEGGVKEIDRFDYEVDEFTGLKTYQKPDFVEDRVFEPCVMHQGGDAFFCGDYEGHIIRVGKVHFLDSWDKVNTNDSVSGVPGLHVGNLDYIRCFQNAGTVTHNVFVDPMDIGAIPHDGTGAIRTRRYFVHSSFGGVNRSLYHSSKYSELTDKEFLQMIEEAVAVEDKAGRRSDTLKTLI